MAYFRTIGGKISVILGGLLILSMATFVYFSTSSLKERLNEQGTAVMLEKANLAKKLAETFHQNNIKSANNLYDILLGSFDKFNRIDSMNLPVEGIDAPAITSGPHILNNDFTIVDEFTKNSGAVATVFGKVGDDFLRVSTSLRKSDGSRAVGTMLGKKSPAYEPIMKGESYMGTAHLFGQDYMTRYSPIYNPNKELIGILFIGYNFTKELQDLRELFSTMRRGDSGYFFVINTKTESIEIHPKDAGKSYKGIQNYEDIANKPEAVHRYKHEGINRIAATVEFKPLNWIIASSNDVDDFMGMASTLEKNLIYEILLLLIGLIIANTYLTSRMIAKPLHVLKDGVADIASGEGDLTKMMDESTKDEISLVSQQINNFINKVRSIIGEIKNISSENSSIAHQFSTSVMQTGKRVEDTTSLVNETTRDSQKIQQEMEGSIKEAKANKEELSNAVHYLDEANESIAHLNTKIQQSVSTEIELARRMEQLSNEAGEVKNVLTVISDIAEQTNLLALNAAIEAARAGEHGKGFAVVADEVRKLAERTQKSLAEINSTINVIVQSISESSETMNANAAGVGELANVSDNVQVKISEMAKAMQKAIQMSEKTVNDYIQSGEKVSGIMQTITKINTLSSENARSIEEMASAANHLGTMGEALDSKLNQFRT